MQVMSMARRFFDDIISSPLNICLVALICYFSYKLIRKDYGSSSSKDARHRDGGGGKDGDGKKRRQLERMPKRDFTLDELRPYDGVQSDGRILIAVLGKVFDVSRSFEFYGPEGPYSVFAGRDASRALATFSVDPAQFKDTYDDLADLKPGQLDSIKEWEMQFLEKYDVVGKLLKPGEEHGNYDEENTKLGLKAGEGSSGGDKKTD